MVQMEKTRAAYRTRQQKLLLGYLEAHKGEHFTAEDLRAHFAADAAGMGTATIYRHLEKLVASGSVHKYLIDEHSAACFEYVGRCTESAGEQHFHLKCEQCGALIHLDCDELRQIRAHLRAKHGFSLNPLRTVFYGRCAFCVQATNAE